LAGRPTVEAGCSVHCIGDVVLAEMAGPLIASLVTCCGNIYDGVVDCWTVVVSVAIFTVWQLYAAVADNM